MIVAGYAPAWAVWLALGLWGVAIILLALAVAYARRLWRTQLRPLAMPMLLAFGLTTGDTDQASGGTDNEQAAATGSSPPDALDVQRAPWKQ